MGKRLRPSSSVSQLLVEILLSLDSMLPARSVCSSVTLLMICSHLDLRLLMEWCLWTRSISSTKSTRSGTIIVRHFVASNDLYASWDASAVPSENQLMMRLERCCSSILTCSMLLFKVCSVALVLRETGVSGRFTLLSRFAA